MSKVKTSFIQIMTILLSVTAILTSGLILVNAANITDDEISPQYVTINNCMAHIEISGLKANCYASVSSDYSTSLSIVIELQKEKSNGYETIETWSASAQNDYLAMEKSRYINRLNNYRIKVTIKADRETTVLYKYP